MRCGNGYWPQGEITIQNWGNVELWKESRQQNYMERPLLEMIIDRLQYPHARSGLLLSYMNKKSEEVKFGKIQLFLTELQHGHNKNRWIPHRILKCVLDKVNFFYGFPELPFIRYHIQLFSRLLDRDV